MNVITRTFNLIKYQIESMISNAEDPENVIDESITTYSRNLEKTMNYIAEIEVHRQYLGQQLYKARTENNPIANQLQAQYDAVSKAMAKAVDEAKKMNENLQKMKQAAPAMKAGATVAKVHEKIQKTVAAEDRNSPMGRFNQAQNTIHRRLISVEVRREVGVGSHPSVNFFMPGMMDLDSELDRLKSDVLRDSLPSATVIQDLEMPKMPEMPNFMK